VRISTCVARAVDSLAPAVAVAAEFQNLKMMMDCR